MKTSRIESFDGTTLAIHRLGSGPPVVMLHGLFSDAAMNWIKFGHAQAVADAGFEAIMPDLRAHGDSDKPHDAESYPRDVLIRDLTALLDRLEIGSYDLVGFSLGARTALHAVIDGLAPEKLVLIGMGLEGLREWDRRAAFFVDAIDRFDEIKRGDPAWFARSFMKSMNTDRIAARHLLGTMGQTGSDELAKVAMPTRVICGKDDTDNGSASALADLIPQGSFVEIPGTHMSSVAEPAMGAEIVRFLKD